MRISGEEAQRGAWAKDLGKIKMTEAQKEVVWLTGMKVKPWQWATTFSQVKTAKHICYKYSFKNEEKGTVVFEREPSRFVDIQEPQHYHGELGQSGSNQWKNVDKVFIVNGHIEKADANFVGSLTFDKVGNTKIYLGQYPQLQCDVDKLH